MTVLFDEATPLGCNAQFTMLTQHHILFGENVKRGWCLPSAFEIKASVTGPVEIYQSKKDRDSYFLIRPVGQTGQRPPVQWYTVTFLSKADGQITTAYNALSFTQKGHKVWPPS